MFAFWRHRLRARAGANLRDTAKPADTAQQRPGHATLPRPRGPLLWVHLAPGASVAALGLLLSRLRDDRAQLAVLVTAGQPTGLPDVIDRLPPPDTDDAAHGFLDHWAPDACLWLGAGWAPVLLRHTAARGIPTLCADARVDAAHARARRWNSALARAELTPFEHILTGGQADALRLIALGAAPERVEPCGWLEASAGALPCDDTEWADMAQAFEARPLWLAVDVPETEYAAVTEAHRMASRLTHRLVLIWVPRDPAQGGDLHARLDADGWQAALRSRGDEPHEDTQIYIADTAGEWGLWYRLAPVTYLGQTLSGSGPGRSPMEPAALGSVVVHGPHTEGHAVAYERFCKVTAQCAAASGAELGRVIERLQAPDRAAILAGSAWEVMTAGAEATDRALALLNDALNRVRH